MDKKTLLSNIDNVEKIASASKLMRMLGRPAKYIKAILFREIIYKRSKKEKEVRCKTFFGAEMKIILPSSTDIYLTGGKSHNSEIRLAKYIIRTLTQNDTFLDIGAHYGYFSLLASGIVGEGGHVISYEAAPKTYKILNQNASKVRNIAVHNNAVSDTEGTLSFYEFPNLYSEYNTLDVSQFENEEWYKNSKPREVKIESIVLDDFLSETNTNPTLIKIDVEGAEYKVISGMKNHLQNNRPIIVMEYLSDDRSNDMHIQAERYLRSENYNSFLIDIEGHLIKENNISQYLKSNHLESDNIVFVKS
jgi:FkbM family methyltransferase